MKIFALSGSLRRQSVNRAILDAFERLAPPGVAIDRYEDLAEIPAFNPDVEDDAAPPAVAALRGRIAASDVVLISSPEYAAGPPGALKNALDWLVGSAGLYEKTVILAHPTTRALLAKESLERTLGMMGAQLRTDAFIPVELTEFAGDGPRPRFAAAVANAVTRLGKSLPTDV